MLRKSQSYAVMLPKAYGNGMDGHYKDVLVVSSHLGIACPSSGFSLL